jgi:hypothetical protein
MDDWEARLRPLSLRLEEWNRTFERELAAVCKERKLVGWFKKPSQVELDSAAIEARRRAGVEVLGEAALYFDELCDHYPKCLPQERCRIRAAIGGHEALFDQWWGYVESGPTRIKGAGDAPLLARAFVAIAIDDMRADLKLLNEVMRRLIVAAALAGLNWRAALDAACKVANRSTGGGAAQMQEFFETFAGSNYFKQRVVPDLRAAEHRAREVQALSRAS